MIGSRFPLLCLLLVLKSVIMIGVILFAGIDLGPEEAQYWEWSRNLDWGYYSKPPGIAWEIWAGCQLFGNTELGVRIGAVVFAFLTSLAIYWLAKASSLKEETAFFAALIMALSPLGVMGSFITVTDGGLILFWTLACCLIVREREPNYFLLGAVVLCGALFKWPMYLIWLFAPFFLRTPKVLIAMAISLFGLLPSVIWNQQHEWVTFRHVISTVMGHHQREIGATYLRQGNLGDFVAAQAGLLSPIFFFFLLAALVTLRWRGYRPLRFCAAVTGLLLLLYTVLSYFQKMQGNWCVFVYPTGVVLTAWYLLEAVAWGKVWIYLGLIAALLQNLFLYSVPYLQRNDYFGIPYKLNIFRHYMGWNRLGEWIGKSGYDPKENFLFGDKYQMSSLLGFYGPGQKRAYFLNMQQSRKNQFSFWPAMAEEQKGKTGYFVLAENNPYLAKWTDSYIADYQKQLEHYFSKVELVGIEPLFEANGRVEKKALIFKCIDYNGKEPAEADLY